MTGVCVDLEFSATVKALCRVSEIPSEWGFEGPLVSVSRSGGVCSDESDILRQLRLQQEERERG